MPVNMDPNKRRRPPKAAGSTEEGTASESTSSPQNPKPFGEETEMDREKDAADAEWKNLWDATEVIDMDKW